MRCFILLFLWFFSLSLKAQSLHFKTFTKKDGLPQNTVTSLIEDDRGFIWIGTLDGIARYDGYKFKTWKKDSQSTNLKQVTEIFQDSKNQIWVGSWHPLGKMSRYIPEKDEWETFDMSLPKNGGSGGVQQRGFVETENHGLWFVSGGMLQNVVDLGDSTFFETYSIPESRKNDIFPILNAASRGDGHIWLATSLGLVSFDLETKEFQFAANQNKDAAPHPVRGIEFDSQGNLYVGFEEGGVGYLPADEVRPRYYIPKLENQPEDLGKISVDFLEISKNDVVKLLSANGLWETEIADGIRKWRHHTANRNKPGRLPNALPESWLEDRNGNQWVGTEGGLSVAFAAAPKVGVISKETIGLESFPGPVYRMCEDSRNQLWIGTSDGLFVMDSARESTVQISLPIPKEPGELAIFGLAEAENGMWACSGKSLYFIDKNELDFQVYDIQFPNELHKQTTLQLTVDEQGWPWIAVRSGLAGFDPKTKTWHGGAVDYRTYFTGFGTRDDSTLWASDSFFLNYFNKKTGKFEIVPRDSTNSQDRYPYWNLSKDLKVRGSEVFGATKSGLHIYNDDSKNWRQITMENGLPSDVIRAIEIDKSGNVWGSTNEGIFVFYPEDDSIQIIDFQGTFPCLEFNSRTSFLGKDGTLYFGCNEGLGYFHPKDLKKNDFQPAVQFTGFQVFNKDIPILKKDAVSEKDLFLKNAPPYLEEVNLQHDHSVFTVEFAALSFFNPDKNTFAHRLVGFDKDWLEDGTKRSVTYTNLDAGEYVLEVKAANNDGLWSDQIAALKINVAPPWYATWWARLFFLAAFAGIIYIIFRIRMQRVREKAELESRIQRAREMEREEFRRRSAADFHDEAGNKLTKINLFTELARGETNGNGDLRKYLHKIEENTKELSAGMRDFLWVMDPEKDSLYDTLVRLQNFGDSMFGDTSTDFRLGNLDIDFQNVMLSVNQRRAIIQIFKEAMNNCAKHAEASKICLETSFKKKNVLHMILKDNGVGISSENDEEKNGYGTKIMKERAAKIGAEFYRNSGEKNGCEVGLEMKI